MYHAQVIPLRKVCLLGAGSYGKVHLACAGPSCFAVKSSKLQDSFSLQKRRIYSRLCHCPGVVHCFGDYTSLEDGGRVYKLVLEYAPFGSLMHLMRAYGGKIPEAHARVFAKMLLKGLSSIHSAGYVHCDLKPGNILVFPPGATRFQELKLADFGLAKEPQRREIPRAGNFRGTPVYMSPESVEFGEIGAKLDTWSLGCVVIEMLTGKPAWGMMLDIKELFSKLVIKKESPQIPENLSQEGKDFLMKCLARDPKERWSADMLLCHPLVLEDQVTNFLGAGGQQPNLRQIASWYINLPTMNVPGAIGNHVLWGFHPKDGVQELGNGTITRVLGWQELSEIMARSRDPSNRLAHCRPPPLNIW